MARSDWFLAVILAPMVGLFAAPTAAQQPAASAGPQGAMVWNLDNLDQLGGCKIQVVGSPQVIDTPQGKAVEFDGQGDALFLDTNPLAGLPQFTAEIVFRPYADGAKEQRFFHMQEAGSENRLLFETRLTADGRWFLDTFLKSGDGNYTLYAEKSLHPIGPWYHAAVTVDGARMRHYVNGVEELSTAIEFVPQKPGETSIGVRMNRVHWFRGAIRQIRITPRVLTPAEFLRP